MKLLNDHKSEHTEPMALNFSKADARYKTIQKRSFETHLDHFILRRIVRGQGLVLDDDFISQFQRFLHADNQMVREEMIRTAIRLWKYASPTEKVQEFGDMTIGEIDSLVRTWYKQFKTKELFTWYCNQFMTREQFRDVYMDNDINRTCEYCGIDERSIDAAVKKDALFSKWLFVRGRSMEIDRKNANQGYEPDNIVLCCYWCNNAKTDEFSHEEFKEIGMKIRETWKKRGIL